jgi:hypothetical protein
VLRCPADQQIGLGFNARTNSLVAGNETSTVAVLPAAKYLYLEELVKNIGVLWLDY